MKVVAFGGGHGLAASLRALRLLRIPLDLEITAIVTVGDDGGSSGRLRAARGGLPPGDLRQALAALADPDDPAAARAAELLQFRFPGHDALAGHAVGNLLLAGLMEMTGDPVDALARAGELVRAVGRVLPMACNAGPSGRHRPRRPTAQTRPRDYGTWPAQRGREPWRRRVGEPDPRPPRSLSGGGPGHRVGRLAAPRSGFVVHQCDSAPAGARSRRRHGAQRCPSCGYPEPRNRAGDGRPLTR